MRGQISAVFVGWAIAWLSGCGADVGDACNTGDDCPGKLCLTSKQGRYQAGYCSADCSKTACGAGQDCRPAAPGSDQAVCLLRCTDRGGCRDGYQCYKGVCQPGCTDNASCGDPGYVCNAGTCVERPGQKIGQPCGNDEECSSTACVEGLCVQICEREQACTGGKTCTLDRNSKTLRSYCVDARGGEAALASCASDDQCDRGTCLMGACLLHCQTATDCGAADKGCTKLPAPLSLLPLSEWPALKACLPKNQVFQTNLSRDKNLLVPETARSVTLFTKVANFDESYAVGLSSFKDPSGRVLYQIWSDADPNGYFRNILRHYPDTGSGALLFSSSPTRAPVEMGAYPFSVIAQNAAGGTTRAEVTAFYKLFDAPISKGKVALRIHVTDLSGLPVGCAYRGMKADAVKTQMATVLSRLTEIYAQSTVNVTFDPVTIVDSDASSSVNANGGLGSVLRVASANTSGGVDLVLVRAISPNGVLGIAGGIPASPGIKGSPHTGAVASVGVLCIPQFGITQETFAVTIAHELGHTMGLSHNREQNGQSDPLGERAGQSESYQQNTANLMYWAEGRNPGTTLTAEQGDVLRSVPQVLP